MILNKIIFSHLGTRYDVPKLPYRKRVGGVKT